MLKPIDFSGVADIYDDYVRVDFDIPFWLAEAKRAGGRVLELGSGTGRVSMPLLRAGVDLTCVDHCPEMLSILKTKAAAEGLSLNIVASDVTDLLLPLQYDLIIFPFNSFSEIVDARGRSAGLSRVRAHLAEGGEFICTLHNPEVKIAEVDGKLRTLGTFHDKSGGSFTVTSRLRLDTRSMVHGFQFFQFAGTDGKVHDRRKLEINYYLPGKTDFERLCTDTGFRTVDLYGDYKYSRFRDGKSPFMIWRLKSVINHSQPTRKHE